MASIVTKRVNGSGPYKYHVETQDYEQEWTYLGKAGQVELEDGQTDMTAEDAEALKDGYSQADVEEIEFHERDAAQDVRDMIPDAHMVNGGDERLKAIRLNPAATQTTKEIVAGNAADTNKHLAEEYGQAVLSDRERDDLDFTGNGNVMHARSVKAIMVGKGVEGWTDYYQPDLSVDEHRGVADNAKTMDGSGFGGTSTDPDMLRPGTEVTDRDMQGMVTDEAEIQKMYASAYNQAQSMNEDRAEDACRDGHGEACDELRDIGWSEERVRELEQSTGSAETFARATAAARRDEGVSPAAGD